MKTHRWTDEELQAVNAKRVRGGVVGTQQKGSIPNATSTASGSLQRRGWSKEAGSNPAPSPQKHPYKSKLELAWATRLEVMRRNGEIDGWIYEPFTFRLAEGKRYRADIIAACRKCGQCRECGRDRKDPCGECRQWDEENRGENGKVDINGVRAKRRKRNV